jgi:hypothetical protein
MVSLWLIFLLFAQKNEETFHGHTETVVHIGISADLAEGKLPNLT